MKLEEAKSLLIGSWGSFGSSWGINRTMAQVHALLLVSSKPLSTEDVMADLSISRGNANMNLRELINWGLLERVVITGERKEYFIAEKDIWKVSGIIARERKKRELEPMLKLLENMDLDSNDNSQEMKSFKDMHAQMLNFGKHVDKTLVTISKANESWFLSNLMKIIK